MKCAEISKARRLAGMTQTALAERVGISAQAMNGYENGARTLGPKLLPLVAQVLDVSPAYLRGEAPGLPVMNMDTGDVILCPIMRVQMVGQWAVYTIDGPNGPMDMPMAATPVNPGRKAKNDAN